MTTLRPAVPDDPDKADDLTYDLGNLGALDIHQIDEKVSPWLKRMHFIVPVRSARPKV